jgi:ribonuclease VapC
MVIDSSALVAIVLAEPDCSFYLDRIAEASTKWISAASMLETSIIVNREKGADGVEILRQFIVDAGIRVAEFSELQATLGFAAPRRFGKGSRSAGLGFVCRSIPGLGHPAQLNILDCCTYALAVELEEPALFKGGDFDKTDIGVVK